MNNELEMLRRVLKTAKKEAEGMVEYLTKALEGSLEAKSRRRPFNARQIMLIERLAAFEDGAGPGDVKAAALASGMKTARGIGGFCHGPTALLRKEVLSTGDVRVYVTDYGRRYLESLKAELPALEEGDNEGRELA